jgi:hypothetical protein
VTTDGVAQRKALDRVYSMIASGSPAQVEIGEFYRGEGAPAQVGRLRVDERFITCVEE